MWGLCLESPVSLNSNSHETLRENGHDSYQAQGCFFFFFSLLKARFLCFLYSLYIYQAGLELLPPECWV